MPTGTLKFCTRTLTAAAAAIVLMASSAHSQKSNPFSKFGGNWTGNGLIHLSNGSKERIRCRGGFIVSDVASTSSLKLELRCAGDSFKIELMGDFNYSGGDISGVWTELTRGVNGNITGKINGDQIQAVAESPTFTATLELISLGDKQQVRITSPGSEMTDVLIGLNRTASR